MNKVTKVIAAVLAILISAGATGLYAYARNDEKNTESVSVSDTSADEKTSSVPVRTASDDVNPEKDETVYVISGSDGSVKNVIVSDWLKNSGALSEITDISDLTNIKNVKGNEAFTQSGSDVKWQADGSDIWYQGNSDKELPVTVKVTYYLDDKEISPSELKGKSGKVKIRFDYTNNQKQTIDGQDVYVPFIMVTGAAFDNAKFTNIQVSDGKTVTNGNTTVAMGYALPGMNDSLALDDKVDIDFPEYFEITADAVDFELDETVTTAFNYTFKSDDSDLTADENDLFNSLNELSDASTKLVNGSSDLYDGVSELLDKSGDLADGADAINQGAKNLETGASKLTDGLSAINTGAADLNNGIINLDNGLSSVKTGAGSISNGCSSLKTGASQLSTGISSVSDGAAKLDAGIDTAYKNLETTIEANKKVLAGLEAMYAQTKSEDIATMVATMKQTIAGQEKIAASMKSGNGGLKDGSAALAAGSSKLKSGASSLGLGITKLNIGATELSAGVDKLTAGSAKLKTGSATLAASTSTAYTGAKNLSAGIIKLETGSASLKSGVEKLIDGVAKLKDGASDLKTGMNKFDKDGVRKLVDAFDGNIEGLLDKVNALKDASAGYTTYSGASENMDSNVKFIYTTEEIK